MNTNNDKLQVFFREIEKAAMLSESVRKVRFRELIKEWQHLIGDWSQEAYVDNFRCLKHLKLSVEWLFEQCCFEKKENKILRIFLQNLLKYIDVEIQCNEFSHVFLPKICKRRALKV